MELNIERRSEISAGLFTVRIAPMRMPRPSSSVPETTLTGMCRVARSCLRTSRTTQPAMSGRPMSSVIAAGWCCLASASAIRPLAVITESNPASAASPESIRAKVGSSSTISRTGLSPCGQVTSEVSTGPNRSAVSVSVSSEGGATGRAGAGRGGAGASGSVSDSTGR